jgi:hypothetical protein
MRPFSELQLQDKIVYVVLAVSHMFATSGTPNVIAQVLIQRLSKHGVAVTGSDDL